MAAIFTLPFPFVAAPTTQTPAAGSVSNLAIDPPGLVWRGTLPTPFIIIDLGASALSYDTVAIVGSNLRATDTVQVQTGITTAGTGGYVGTATAAWSGVKVDTETVITVIRLGSMRSERYVRIDFSATSHPDGYVQVQRLCIGRGVSTLGIDFNAELAFEDGSVITSGPGYRAVDEYPVLTSFKFSTGWISEASFRADWYPLLQIAGNRRAILVIPNDAATYQTDYLFGCLTQRTAGKNEFYNGWRVEGVVTSLSQ